MKREGKGKGKKNEEKKNSQKIASIALAMIILTSVFTGVFAASTPVNNTTENVTVPALNETKTNVTINETGDDRAVIQHDTVETTSLYATADFNELTTETVRHNESQYDLITIKGCGLTSDIGEPALPVKTVFVLIPLDKEVEDVQFFVTAPETLAGNYTIYPAQPPATCNQVPDFVEPDPVVYASTTPIPKAVGEFMQAVNFRGYKLALVKVHPVQYVPATGEVRFFRTVRLKLSLTPSAAPVYVSSKMLEIDGWVAKNVINPEMVSEYEAPSPAVDYLIITRDMFSSQAEALKSHKESTGLTVAIETVEDITSTYLGRDSAEQIRNCIVDYYTTSGIQWVLLMGDADPYTHYVIDTNWEVPTRYMYNPDYYTYTPTDYYYAGLDGDWDADGDSRFGESSYYSFVDEADWYPEVFVGRITAMTTDEMETQIVKLVNFTNTTIDCFLMCGAVSDPSTDEKQLKEYIRDNFVPPSVITDELYESDGTLTETNVIDRINNHQPEVVNSAGHGSYTGLWPGPFFDTGTPASITNHPYLWYAMACLAGGFDYDYGDCVGEAMMKDPDGSAIAWVGGTRVTWYWVGYPQHLWGLNGMQDWLFWDEFFNQMDYRPGTCLYNSKVSYLGYGPDLTDEAERKNLFAYQLLGDPEILIGEVIPDVTPPAITNVTAQNLTCGTARIIWDTDELADGLVKYGNASGIYTMEIYDSAWVTSHSIELTGLSPVTTYYFVVNSTDWSGNSNESAEYNFTTEEEPDIWVVPTEIYVNCSQGDVVNRTLTIGNDGNGTLVWEITDVATATSSAEEPQIGIVQEGGYTTYETLLTNLGYTWVEVPATVTATWLQDNNIGLLIQDGSGSSLMDTTQVLEYQAFYDAGGTLWISYDDVSDTIFEQEMRTLCGASDFADYPESSTITFVAATYPNGAPTNVSGRTLNFGQSDQEYVTPDACVVLDDCNEATILDGGNKFVLYLGDTVESVSDVSATGTLGRLFESFVNMWGVEGDVDWLTEDPTEGTIAPQDQTNVTATIDATDLEPGDYNATIQIASNDPDEPLENVSVYLSVLPPEIWVEPTEIEVMLAQNMTHNTTLTIGNDGNGTLLYDITDVGGSRTSYTLQLPGGAEMPSGTANVLNGSANVSEPAELIVNNVRVSGEPIDVLLVAADDSDAIRSMLLAFDDINTVDQFDARYGTPTLSELQGYDAVIVWPQYLFYDAVGLGDVLADYVDSGGKVILSGLCWTVWAGFGLEGRIMEPEYSPFAELGDNHWSYADLGWYDPAHPIMDGVSSATDYLRDYVMLNDGAELVAEWDDGELFVGVQRQGSVIGVNSYIGDYYEWTGDIPIILHNALVYAAGTDWLTEYPTEGAVAPGEYDEVTVTINTTGLEIGDYSAEIIISNNDLDENPVIVPVNLSVVNGSMVSVVPDYLSAYVETNFTLNISVDPFGLDVYAGQFDLYFDPDLLEVLDVVQGPFLSQDGASTFVVINEINNTIGRIRYAETRTGTYDGVTEPGTLASIAFRATNMTGLTDVDLDNVKLSFPDESAIPAIITNGEVLVREYLPIPVIETNHTKNNAEFPSYFNCTKSWDPTPGGYITSYTIDFGDGTNVTGGDLDVVEYTYVDAQWWASGYLPYNVTLTVTNNYNKTNSTTGELMVWIAGDANGNGIVDIFDGVAIGRRWDAVNTDQGWGPLSILWEPIYADRTDLNNDDTVNIIDAGIVGYYWDETAY